MRSRLAWIIARYASVRCEARKEGHAGPGAGKGDKGDSQDLKDVLAFGFDEATAREQFAANGGDKEKTVNSLMQLV